jgi:Carboxypeptidase regulatory-like domain
MVTSQRFLAIGLVLLAILLLPAGRARAQVTTATLYGVVHDTSGAVLPGVSVTVTHEGTNLTRATVSDERGEFALPALPAGPYAVKIELPGFKTYESRGLALAGGQTVRQSYTLEVGNVAEKITVTEAAPLIETVTTAQTQTLSTEVREIPVSRRNLQNVVLLAGGINSTDNAIAGGRPFRVNGVGDGGSAINVDGSSAQTNPENRGFGNPSQVQGPGRRRVDLAIAKSFTIRGEARVQVRAEAFNAFNWLQYNDPVLMVTQPNFGRITSVAGTRTGQIGARLTF